MNINMNMNMKKNRRLFCKEDQLPLARKCRESGDFQEDVDVVGWTGDER